MCSDCCLFLPTSGLGNSSEYCDSRELSSSRGRLYCYSCLTLALLALAETSVSQSMIRKYKDLHCYVSLQSLNAILSQLAHVQRLQQSFNCLRFPYKFSKSIQIFEHVQNARIPYLMLRPRQKRGVSYPGFTQKLGNKIQ